MIRPNINSIRGTVFIPSSAYRTTTGLITRSDISYVGGRAGGFKFNIAYLYSVAGNNYQSEQVSFGQIMDDHRAFAESYVRKYPVGTRTMVYYKADEPTFAVLEPNNVGQTWGVFWTLSGFCVVCLFGVVRSLWRFWRAS